MRYDLHVHTHLSDCASREAFFPLYIKAAEENRQTLLGFADHSWASGVEGATPWYRKQPFERLAEQKKQLTDYLAEHPSPVKVLQGAEGEFANFLLGIDEEAAQYADYIIVPHDHVHMKGFVIPEEQTAPKEMALFLLKSFEALCKHPKRDLFVGLCHPMVPCCMPWQFKNEVYRYLTDPQLKDALTAAKEAGVWIELNLSEFACVPPEELENYEYIRFFRIAKEVGNTLYWGSDAHAPRTYRERLPFAARVLEVTGLTEDLFDEAEKAMLSRA